MGLELCDKAATLVASPQVLIFLCVFENVEAVEMMQRGLGLRRGREPSRRRHDARANGAAAAQSHLTRHSEHLGPTAHITSRALTVVHPSDDDNDDDAAAP